jgi:hypothetical protein
MKKTILSLLMMSLLVMMTNSCSKSNPSSSGGKYSWSCEVNGKSYSWSGNYPDGTNPSSMGLSTFTETTLGFYLPTKQNIIPFGLIVNFENIPTQGTYTFEGGNFTSTKSCNLVIDKTSATTFYPGSSMKVTISAIPSNTYINTQGVNPGSVNGTFSGTMYSPDLNNPGGPLIRYEITNGKYEAIVIN